MSTTIALPTAGAVFECGESHARTVTVVAFRNGSTVFHALSQYGYGSGVRCCRDGGQGADHFDPSRFQRRGAIRRS
jgi:hypothetical protein